MGEEQPRLHRPDRDLQDLGDLLVGETLEIPEADDRPELGGELLQRPLDLVVQEVGPDSQRAFRSLVPKYDDVDAATAMVDTVLRTD